MSTRNELEQLTKTLTDSGKLIEAGWVSLVLAIHLEDASPIQLQEMRKAFFAGAQHLFVSIMTMLEPGLDPTEKDLARMDKIHEELKAYVAELKRQTNRN